MVQLARICKNPRFFSYIPKMRAVFTSTRLISPQQTAREMLRIAQQYAGDLGEMAKWPVKRFFDHVRKLPYRPDPPKAETLSRPLHTLQKDFPFRDCDDKAILMGAWCHANGVPFGFYASSTRNDGKLHHVWTVAEFPSGRAVVLDPTYHYHKIGVLPQKDKLTKVLFLQGSNMYLNTFEGRETLGFSLKSIKKGVSKAAKSTVKTVKKTGTQIKKGNVIKAVKTAAKPIPYASRTISSAQKAAGQIKRGKVLSAVKTAGRAVIAPAKDAASLVGKIMPAVIKTKIKSAVKKVAGDKVTGATKMLILPAATAAALAVPGAQPFAAGIGVVVNAALDEIIAAGKKKAATTIKAVTRTTTAARKAPALQPSPAKSLSMTDRAQATAAALKNKMQKAKQSAIQNEPAAAQEAAQEAAPAGMSTKTKIALGAGVGAVALYAISRRKKGRS